MISPADDSGSRSSGLPPRRPPSITTSSTDPTEPAANESTAAAVPANETRNQSKYDFVKVRVWVGDHFYVLSRYLVSRALVSTKINSRDAVTISLELKKTLVDLALTDIEQEQFENFLYKTMLVYGYGESHVECYRMMSSFHRNRTPLLIILAGTVLQTDLIFELMCNFSGYVSETSLSDTVFASDEALLAQYTEDCSIVRKGVNSDIDKCLKEGKSLIIEGLHIDPRLYQAEVGHTVPSGGIVIPFLLTIDPEDHKSFIESSPDPRYKLEKAANCFKSLQVVQTYLKKDSAPFIEVPVDIHSLHGTLDAMHDVVLQRIEQVYRSTGVGSQCT
ncbi:hypothetical protein DYB25_009476 [Aphanomyces astaci]|uniref:Uncharacterized protein n=1 Tax=Aphanomyces astaci TaxID=112090 RepID=A0A397AXT6_APHAT|nr:hypothetical protein DYB25_009476 [Aphanomyces astaci]RHY12603.1 hypothetical protein DYB36_002364 [Aphanomyces astaci]RHY33774.1 hypothetical protein DYB34_011051 [Aphanomyces astaci]RHY39894.1 hypothetical protein DYB30_007368 [Aphanomyces astaci]RHY56971.1 hypothetical protein DYB38_002536 [Aphanomyces astaci]